MWGTFLENSSFLFLLIKFPFSLFGFRAKKVYSPPVQLSSKAMIVLEGEPIYSLHYFKAYWRHFQMAVWGSALVSGLIEPLMSVCFWFVVGSEPGLWVRQEDNFAKIPEGAIGASLLKCFLLSVNLHTKALQVFFKVHLYLGQNGWGNL